MKYRVSIDGTERECDLQKDAQGTYSVRVDGSLLECEVHEVPGGVLLRIDGRVYDVAVASSSHETHLAAGVHRAPATVQSERERMSSRRQSMLASSNEVRAPMPGRVVKVLVSEGVEVSEGDPVIVVEAMKMENELRAPCSGSVKSIEVTEGQSVDGGALMVVFD